MQSAADDDLQKRTAAVGLPNKKSNGIRSRSQENLFSESNQPGLKKQSTAMFKYDSPNETDDAKHSSNTSLSKSSGKELDRAENQSDKNQDEDSSASSSNSGKKHKRNLFQGQLEEMDDSGDEQGSISEKGSDPNKQQEQQRLKRKRQKRGQKSNTRLVNDKKIAAMNFNKSGDNMNFKKSIEIRNGIAIRSTNNVHKMTNAISLHCYIGTMGFLMFIYDMLAQPDHVILIANLFLEYASGIESLQQYSHIIAIATISFLGTGLMNSLADAKLREAGDQVNNKPIERFVINKRSRKFIISNWAQIQCGDIIKIKMNQEIPCDALILDIVGSRSANQTCYTRGGLFDDDYNPSYKRSYQGTMNKTGQRIQASKFVDQISGMLKWEYNHQGYFTGSFKQENSPTAFEITPENIVQRGCYMQHATQAICLALNVGPNTMGNQYYDGGKNRFQKMLLRRTKTNHFESVHFTALRYIQYVSIIFCLFPCVMIVLQDLLLKNLQVSRFVSSFVQLDTKFTMANYTIILSGFLQNFPYLAKLTMEAVIFFHAYFTMWDINLVPAQLNYNDLKIMKSMGQIDSIVCPKSAFLWHNTSFPAAFQINNVTFFNQNEKNERLAQVHNAMNDSQTSVQNAASSSDEDEMGTLDYLPNQYNFDPTFHSQNAQKLFDEVTSEDSVQFRELLLALALCHHATQVKNQASKDGYARQTYKSMFKDEEAQLHFAHSFDFKFIKRRKRKATILQEGVERTYEEFLFRRIKVGEDYLTCSVVKPSWETNSGLTIYYRANLRLLQKFLPPEQSKQCKQDFQKFKGQGIHSYGLAKHVVEPEDALTFLHILNENIRKSKSFLDNKNDKFMIKLAKDLNFIGVFGLQVAFNYRDTLLIEDLRRNGIKLYMLSGEDNDNVQTDCNAMNLLEGFTDPIVVQGTTERQVEESLKSCLKEVLKRRLESKAVQPNESNGQQRPNKKVRKDDGGTRPQDGGGRRKKKQNQQEKQQNDKQYKNQFEYKAADVDRVKESNVLLFQGTQLNFILRDQTLEKLYLSLCNLCSLCIGTSVTPMQRKFVVRAIRQFAVQGKLGNVISIISQQTDKMTIEEADITVGLIQNYKQSDVLARTDVQMKNLYGLTYLFFKHGTLAHRRTKVVLQEFIGRTVTTQLISIFFFFLHGFSYQLPYGRIFFSFFMAVQTPLQFWLQGISHTDYGYSVYHRIFGEYRFNLAQQVSIQDFFEVCFNSALDAVMFMLCFLSAGPLGSDYQSNSFNGQEVSWQTHIILNDVLLTIINIARSRSLKSNVLIIETINQFFALFSMIMLLEDPYLAGINSAIRSPHVLACIVLMFFYVQLKQFMRLVYEIVLPWNRSKEMRYKAIEDKIFMEEYENPEQQFSITSLESYAHVAKSLEANSIFSINQNLLIVHRSDSMDHILERLNYQSSRIAEDNVSTNFSDNASAFINTFNLKLHDINKEIEYNQMSQSYRQVASIIPLLWSSVFLFGCLLLFKVTNSIVESKYDVDKENTSTSSSTLGSTAATSYFEVFQSFLSLSCIYAVKKVRYSRPLFLAMMLVVISNIMIVAKFFSDQKSPLIQVQFLFTIAFSFGIRLTSFYIVSIITIIASFAFLQIRLSVIVDQTQKENSSSVLQLSWMSGVIVIYIVLWIFYAYQDELKRKVNFVTQYRRVKEFQKLKSIVNILIPAIVRSRLQDGKKIQSDSKSYATVLWAEIDEFDFLIRKYHGRDFTELLEKVYNGLDSLCEQYGLQVIDTVGKAFVACGGLKFSEKNLDPRLLTSYHSVRVIEFAVKAQNFVKHITLHDGRKASIKIGIHSGNVMCGVIGDLKPQFTIIGSVVNKAAQICKACQGDSILISRESYKKVVNKVNNFLFTDKDCAIADEMKEKVYSVQKRRGTKKRFVDQEAFQPIRAKKQVKKISTSIKPFASLVDDRINDEDKNLTKKYDSDDDDQFLDEDSDVAATEQSMESIGKNSINRSEQIMNDSFQEDKNSLDGSLEDVNFNRRNFSDYQDDRKIVQIAALNDKYKLVERPRFLLQFDNATWEQKFGTWVFRKHFQTELANYIMKAIFDVILAQAAVISVHKWEQPLLNVAAAVGVIGLKIIEIFALFGRKVKKPRYIFWQFISFLGSFAVIIIIGPVVNNFIYREAIEVTFAMYMMLAFLTRSFQFKIYAALISSMSGMFVLHNYVAVLKQTVNLQTYVIESLMNLIFVGFLIMVIYTREMKHRKTYNSERIIEVEIRRTEEMLNKLVPEHALIGIKNDSKVVDVLDNVTILYCKLVGFDEYYKANQDKPADVLGLLSRLYSKFDNLCEQYSIYKVHTLGDIYVIIGYRGKVSGEKRTQEDALSEAYNMLQAAHQLCEIVREERDRLKDPNLQNLDVQVGLNTGKIVAGIIGTKVVRYDIFGQDVLIANLIMRIAGQSLVTVSASFRQMIAQKPFISDTFDWQEYRDLKVPETDKVVKTYTCEQIFVELDSFYEENDSEKMATMKQGGGEAAIGGPSKTQ